jgi:hypothetical protein
VSSVEDPARVTGQLAAAVRDPLAVPEAVLAARQRSMSERLELALSWNAPWDGYAVLLLLFAFA